MLKRSLGLAAVGMVVASVALSQLSRTQAQGGRPTLEADLAAIAEFNKRYLGAINDEDIATLSSLTTEDHIMLAPGRPPTVGKAANDAANSRVFQQFGSVETWTPVETMVSGDLAYQRGTYTVDATPKAGGGKPTSSRGNFMRIYRRQSDGQWRMTRDMFNSDSRN